MENFRAVINGVLCTVGLWGFSTAVVIIQFLSLFIWPFSRKLYHAYHAHMMRQWAQNLFQIMRIFAPGELIITMDESCTDEGTGITDEVEEQERDNDKLELLLTRNKKGRVTGISFPERLIMISNHQVRLQINRERDMYLYSTLDLCRLDIYLVFSVSIESSWCIKNHVKA